jgi:ribose transport system permease protein
LARSRRIVTAAARYGSFNWAGLLLAMIAVGVVFAATSPFFLNVTNFANLSRAVGFTGIVAAITTLVLVAGAIDLSIAAMMSLAGVATAWLLRAGYDWPIALVGGLVAGVIGGAVNGLIVTRTGINPLIATIATQFLMRGIAFLMTGGFPVPMYHPVVSWLGAGSLFGVPVPAILMVLAFLVVGFLLNRTRFGIHAQAIGGSPGGSMARLAGVPVIARKMQIFVLSGLFSAIGGIVLLGYTSTGDPNAAFGQELPIIAAVIMGGTSLGGGRGSVFGTLLGVVLLGEIYNGLTLNNLRSDWQYVVQGVALLVAVFVDEYRSRKSRTESGRQ